MSLGTKYCIAHDVIYELYCPDCANLAQAERAHVLGPHSEGSECREAPCQGRGSEATEQRSGRLDMENGMKQAVAGGQAKARGASDDCGVCGQPMAKCACDFGV